MVRGAPTKHTQLALRARQIPAAAKLGDYALGLRPRLNTPGYPLGTKQTCASALTRGSPTGHVRLTTLSACGLDHIQPGTHRVKRPPRTSAFVSGSLSLLLRGHIAKEKKLWREDKAVTIPTASVPAWRGAAATA